ncbi:nicotinate-nucleotide adenylyltransferase [Conexibacter woesei]|uniref:Probable nicotinate-nucleotide adenylyltransferase n=1 Tax=Conexibacter woesei (strain DSM 14684 / CCUG 47730 / CIP 108061 / JCM 11494 / NBRC 100937 / ID131577) TaxID=469383 RepID=D3F9N0_CONWI|nr:nicotinate-nucleotide adenylyltransferase [Conexibacter woesei]ADB51092.1 nicotinate (nicotinamide) nucleotide adenylyltransferase [Conexibacter woesei DSM 14684]
MRVGILGGTFNPPHLAHLVCAQEAHAQLGLDRVVLMPAGVPPHKQVPAGDPSAEARYELCRLAVDGDERFEVSRAELERPGRSYTADTLRLLRERDPQDELTFIVGGDMARSLPSWREPEAVLALATLAVAERRGAKREAIERELAPLRGADRVRFFEMPRVDVSSSLVRERVAAGRPIRYLVPDAVAEAIAAGGLYRGVPGEVTT